MPDPGEYQKVSGKQPETFLFLTDPSNFHSQEDNLMVVSMSTSVKIRDGNITGTRM